MHRPKPRFDTLSTSELNAKSSALLAAGSHKEAIEAYKQLLKREQQPDWRAGLAQAYLERAKDLAAKHMYKEAAVLWENRAALGDVATDPDLYLDWLVRGGQVARAVDKFMELATGSQAKAERERSEALFAALLLSGHQDIAQKLPVESLLIRHHGIAQTALRAYCQGAAAEHVRGHLKDLSFRSPYKDFRQLLNALLTLESDPLAALPLLERIPADSPFSGLVEAVRPGALSGGARAEALLRLAPVQRELAADLLGLDKNQLRLLKPWQALRDQYNDKALLNFITSHLPALDKEQARRACLALLTTYPQSRKSYDKLFSPLSPFEEQRVAALRAEQEDNLYSAETHWRECFELLQKDPKNPDGALGAALVLRHLVELLTRERPGAGLTISPTLLQYLETSLQLDPDDKASYLILARLYQKTGNRKAYNQWVDKAIGRFPEDSEVLLAATEAAISRQAFKKAAGFAARLLQLDPINSKARNILINAHLSHARKSLKAGKYHLVEKELDSASELEREGRRSGLIEINRGLLAFRQHQSEPAERWLKEGVALADGVLSAGLRLWVEADRLDLPPEAFQDYLATQYDKPVTRAQLMAFIELVKAYLDENVEFLGMALEMLAKPLKKAVKEVSSEQDMQTVCEVLSRVPHYGLLEYYAVGALKRWKDKPLFVYYQIYARAEGDIYEVSDRDYDRLEQAAEQAGKAQDARVSMLIGGFLSSGLAPFPLPPGGGPPPFPLPPGGGLPPLPADIDEALEELREDLLLMPPEARKSIVDGFLQALSDDLGKPPPPELREIFMNALLGMGDDDEFDEFGDFLGPIDGPFPFPSGPLRSPKSNRKQKKKKKARRR